MFCGFHGIGFRWVVSLSQRPPGGIALKTARF
jgi:hypothetical protein